MSLTITEALAEIKTISKRINSKRDFIGTYLYRQDGVKDPLEKDGGSAKAIAEALQGVNDLEKRVVDLRRGIQLANETNTITLEGETRSISDWLVWRREVAPVRASFLTVLKQSLKNVRDNARRQGQNVIGFNVSATTVAEKPTDVIVNIDEKSLADESEKIQTILGTLDGQLSLKNATVTVSA